MLLIAILILTKLILLSKLKMPNEYELLLNKQIC